MPKRRKLAKGIYWDAYGIGVVYSLNGVRQPEKRFAHADPLDKIIRWRKQQIGQGTSLTPREPRGSLPRDVVRYLKGWKGRPGYKAEKSHLRAWLRFLGPVQRWKIKEQDCDAAFAEWRQQGYSDETLRKRYQALLRLFQKFDGKRAPTPLDNISKAPKPKARPVSVSNETIREVATNLYRQEVLHRLRDSKTRARFLVLASGQQRPCEVMRAQPGDVDLERRVWFVRGAKGGYSVEQPLNTEQVAAWTLFIQARAWGPYDSRSFSKTMQRNGWPKGIRVYNTRHSTAAELDARDVELGDLQKLLGHTSPETTRIYNPGLRKRLRAATEKLDGRLGPLTFRSTPKRLGGNLGRVAKPAKIRNES